jgi:uncharacterized membrane protein
MGYPSSCFRGQLRTGDKMSFTHLHLMLNHFPVIGTLIGLVLLGIALLRKSNELSKVSLGLFVALGAISLFVYLTGEPAEEAIEKLPGFSEGITEKHEEAALFATIVLVSFGALALAALALFRRKVLPQWITLAGFAFALASSAAMGYTSLLGGQVRHTEIRSSSLPASVHQENPD